MSGGERGGGRSRLRDAGRSGLLATRLLEAAALVLLPAGMAAAAFVGSDQAAAVSLAASVASLSLFFLSYEWGRPGLREVMPVVVMAALAAAGRILFAPIPDVKPVSAIAIVAGATFGRKAGFMVGALAALVSNFFFGQGAWTPWQMYAWGLVGWLAGVLAARGAFRRQAGACAYGFASGLIYGLVVNLWSLIGFFHPHTLAEAFLVLAPAVPLDCVHGAATAGFLALLWKPWHRKLARLKAVYGL